MTVSRRILSSVLANGIGKIWVLLIQLVTVPVISVKWGPSGYGVWLMLSTVPTYVALGNFGFGTAATVDMTRHYAKGERESALGTFQSAWILVSSVFFCILLADLAVWLCRDRILNLIPNVGSREDTFNAAVILVVYSVFAMEMAFFASGYMSTRRNAEGTFLYDLTIPTETCALIAACLLGGSMSTAALAITAVRVLAGIAYYVRLRRYEPWLKIGWSHASLHTIRRLAQPAIASLSMTLSAALSLEGLILSLGLFVSPAATAVFATARMVTRIPLQVVGLTSRATLPEMTAAFSSGDKALSARLIILNLGFTAAVATPFAAAFIIFGPYILATLSRNRLHAGSDLFVWLALVALFQATWNTFAQFLFAINKQHRFAYYYLFLAALTASGPLLVGHTATVARSAMVWCGAEAVMLAIVYRAWRAESDLDYSVYAEGASRFISDGKMLFQQIFDR